MRTLNRPMFNMGGPIKDRGSCMESGNHMLAVVKLRLRPVIQFRPQTGRQKNIFKDYFFSVGTAATAYS